MSRNPADAGRRNACAEADHRLSCQFGYTLPDSVRRAVTSRLGEAVPYCDVTGMPSARETILAYHLNHGLQGITADDIFIVNGVSEVSSMLMTALMGTCMILNPIRILLCSAFMKSMFL